MKRLIMGYLELVATRIELTSAASTPIPIDSEHTSLDIRLDNRVVDLRINPSNALIFKISSEIEGKIVSWLRSMNFCQIHTPKILQGTSEGGSSLFPVSYFREKAFLAQSPQLYKQMAICSGFKRVFEVGPIFRAESSNTHRHLTEFTGIDIEMELNDEYSSMLGIVSDLMLFIGKELDSPTLFPLIELLKVEGKEKLKISSIPVISFVEARQLISKSKDLIFASRKIMESDLS